MSMKSVKERKIGGPGALGRAEAARSGDVPSGGQGEGAGAAQGPWRELRGASLTEFTEKWGKQEVISGNTLKNFSEFQEIPP